MLRKMGRASAHRCRSLICDADQPFQPAFKNNRSHSLSFRPPPLAGQALPPLGLGVGRYAPSPALSPPGLPLPSVGLASARKGKPKAVSLSPRRGRGFSVRPAASLAPAPKDGAGSLRPSASSCSLHSFGHLGFASPRCRVRFGRSLVRLPSACKALFEFASAICRHQGLNLPPLCCRSARAPLRPRLAPLVRLAHSKSALRA
jgi:hypothetical protein